MLTFVPPLPRAFFCLFVFSFSLFASPPEDKVKKFTLKNDVEIKIVDTTDGKRVVYLNDKEILLNGIAQHVSQGNTNHAPNLVPDMFFIETPTSYYFVSYTGEMKQVNKKLVSKLDNGQKLKEPTSKFHIVLDDIVLFEIKDGEKSYPVWFVSQNDKHKGVRSYYFYSDVSKKEFFIDFPFSDKGIKTFKSEIRNGITADSKGESVRLLNFIINGNTYPGPEIDSFLMPVISSNRVLDPEGKPVLDLRKFIDDEFGFVKLGQALTEVQEEELKYSSEIRQLREAAVFGSAIEIAEGGAGKSYDLELFAQAILSGRFPELNGYEVVKLSASKLEAGSKYKGRFTSLLEAMKVYSKKQQGKVIWLTDEMHSLRGTGTHSGSDVDAFEHIKPELGKGEIKMMGATTPEHFKKYFAGDETIRRRFQVFRKEKISSTKTAIALKSELDKRGIRYNEEVISDLIFYSNKYGHVSAQPGRAVQLALKSAAKAVIENFKTKEITVKQVKESVVELYGVNKALFDNKEANTLLENSLKIYDEHVIGVEKSKILFYDGLEKLITGASKDNSVSNFIIQLGTPGVGKTYLSRIYSQEVLGNKSGGHGVVNAAVYGSHSLKTDEDFLAEIGQYLLNNAWATVAIEEPDKARASLLDSLLDFLSSGYLTTYETVSGNSNDSKNPIQVLGKYATIILNTNAGEELVLDTFTKTYSDVLSRNFSKLSQNMSLAELNRLELEAGKEFSDQIKDIVYGKLDDSTLRNELEKKFKPALVNRAEIAPVLPPTRYEFREGLKLEAKNFISRYSQEQKIEIEISNLDSFYNLATEKFYQPGSSYRDIARINEKLISKQVRKAFLKLEGNNRLISLKLDLNEIEKRMSISCDKFFLKPQESTKTAPIGFKFD